MSNTVRTPEDVLQALYDRLDELQSRQSTRFADFQAHPDRYSSPPTAPPTEQQEIDSIHAAIARQHQTIAAQETAARTSNIQPEITETRFGQGPGLYYPSMRTTQTGIHAGGQPTTHAGAVVAAGGSSRTVSSTMHGIIRVGSAQKELAQAVKPEIDPEALKRTFIDKVKNQKQATKTNDLKGESTNKACDACNERGSECKVDPEMNGSGKCEQCINVGIECSLAGL